MSTTSWKNSQTACVVHVLENSEKTLQDCLDIVRDCSPSLGGACEAVLIIYCHRLRELIASVDPECWSSGETFDSVDWTQIRKYFEKRLRETYH